MTEQEAIRKLNAIAARGQTNDYAEAQARRIDADVILLAFLRDHGCVELVEAWENVRDSCWPEC